MSAHFMCKQRTCIEQKYIVFATRIGLLGHMSEVHGAKVEPVERRDLRALGTDFYDSGGRGRESGSGNRERNWDSTPQQQPSGTQRVLAVGLTKACSTSSGSTPVPPRNIPALLPGADPILAERYRTLFSKISITSDQARVADTVKLLLWSYRDSRLTARELMSSIWNVLGQNINATTAIVNLTLHVLDEDVKKANLLNGWNTFKTEQRSRLREHVPTSAGTIDTGISSEKILNIKRQMSPTLHPRQQLLERVQVVASSSSRSQPKSQFSGDILLPSTPRLQQKYQNPISYHPFSPHQKQMTGTDDGQSSGSNFRPQSQQPTPVANNPQTGGTIPSPLSDSMGEESSMVIPNRSRKESVLGNRSLEGTVGYALPIEPAGGQGTSSHPSSLPHPPELETPVTRRGKGKRKRKQKQTPLTPGGP